MACNYSIGVAAGARMRLRFTVFEVEQDYDFLTVRLSSSNYIVCEILRFIECRPNDFNLILFF